MKTSALVVLALAGAAEAFAPATRASLATGHEAMSDPLNGDYNYAYSTDDIDHHRQTIEEARAQTWESNRRITERKFDLGDYQNPYSSYSPEYSEANGSGMDYENRSYGGYKNDNPLSVGDFQSPYSPRTPEYHEPPSTHAYGQEDIYKPTRPLSVGEIQSPYSPRTPEHHEPPATRAYGQEDIYKPTQPLSVGDFQSAYSVRQGLETPPTQFAQDEITHSHLSVGDYQRPYSPRDPEHYQETEVPNPDRFKVTYR